MVTLRSGNTAPGTHPDQTGRRSSSSPGVTSRHQLLDRRVPPVIEKGRSNSSMFRDGSRKRPILIAVVLAAAIQITAAQQGGTKYKDTSLSPDERAADLVGQMTLEEKAAQMQNAAPA